MRNRIFISNKENRFVTGRVYRYFLILVLLSSTLCVTLSCKKHSSDKDEIRFLRAAEISLEDSPFFLYIPTEEEVNDYLLFAGYLADLESGKIGVTKEQMEDLFAEMYNVDNLHSLTFEAFLQDAKNPVVRKLVREYLESHTVVAEFKTALIRKYNSIPETAQRKEGKEVIRYNYNDEFYDENITLFNLAQTTFFDGSLSVLLYQNKWQSMGFSPEPNIRSFALATGGKTNSLAMNFGEYSYIDFEDFLSIAKNSIYERRYKNWQLKELPVSGILEKANADKILIGCGEGQDSEKGVESAALVLYLYDSELQKGYEIVYYMNYAKENISRPLRARQCNLLLFNLLFCYMK